jgi:WD40 repeat protein/predicted Ser/Thr protein kinase
LTPERFARIEELFGAVREMDPETRRTFLDRACADDPALLADVTALLGCDDDPPVFLRSGFIDRAFEQTLDVHAPVPDRIGRYRILRKLGEGGFGVVYLAEQDNPRRPVAVKVLKPHVATAAVLKRFEYEAEVLGRLVHPGIGRIYEADSEMTTEGTRAFFAMEYVDGRDFNEHVRAQALGPRDTLDLLARVCDAIEYAHLQGVIHRDLKPHNVLVGADGQPRIVDFGVARETAPGDATRMTDAGHLLGTLPYMSPEQLEGDPRAVDTRCDIYALGVMMYQVLSGRLPLDLQDLALAEAIRRRCSEDPRPLGALVPALRGEVETLVAKALTRDRARRYQSAGALATDIRRYLAGEPIEAKRDSSLYVLRKRLQRYRGAAVAGVVILFMALTFSGISLYQSHENRLLALREATARRAADDALSVATSEEARANVAANDLTLELRSNHIERGRLLGLTGEFRAAEEMIWDEYLRWPDCTAARWALWELYSRFPCVASLPGHSAGIRAVAVSPDRRWFATGGMDRQVRLWDETSFSATCVLDSPAAALAIAFAENGRDVVVGDTSGQLRIWDRVTGVSLRAIQAHRGAVRALALIRGDALASAGDDGAVRVWRLDSLSRVDEITVSPSALNAIVATADGGQVFAAGEDSLIHVLSLVRPPGPLRIASHVDDLDGHRYSVAALAIAPDGAWLASGGRDRSVRLWRLPDRECTAVLQPANGAISSLAFSPDSRTLAEAGWWSVDEWEVESGRRIATLPTSDASRGLAYIGPERLISANTKEASPDVHIWETAPRRALRGVAAHGGGCRCLDLRSDGRMVATGGADCTVRLWSVVDNSMLGELPAHADVVTGVRFSPNGRVLACATDDGWLETWDLAARVRLRSWPASCPLNAPIVFMPDSNQILSGRIDGGADIWDLAADKAVAQFPAQPNENLSALIVSQLGLIATHGRDWRIRLFELNGTTLWRTLTPPNFEETWCLAASSDGRQLAAGTLNHSVLVWNLGDQRLVAQLNGHAQMITGVAFGTGPTEGLLASCSSDGEIKLWDWQNTACLTTLTADAGAATGLAFALDQPAILASYADGTFGTWDLNYYNRHIEGNRASQQARVAGP